MFEAKHIGTSKVVNIYNARVGLFYYTYFLVWEKEWYWDNGANYVLPFVPITKEMIEEYEFFNGIKNV